jgi:hypothetical protein
VAAAAVAVPVERWAAVSRVVTSSAAARPVGPERAVVMRAGLSPVAMQQVVVQQVAGLQAAVPSPVALAEEATWMPGLREMAASTLARAVAGPVVARAVAARGGRARCLRCR